ncbi:MAG: PEP/pyruvate-binding domain-containing protein [Methanobacteriota archaeon]
MPYVAWANNVDKGDIELVGGKGANLGELMGIGLPVPPAFAVTAPAYREFLAQSGLAEKIGGILSGLDVDEDKALKEAAKEIREAIVKAGMPAAIRDEIEKSYASLSKGEREESSFVAVRSSATAEDLPEASFAGQQDTYLNIRGAAAVVDGVLRCWASLFTSRAIFYRVKHSFDHGKVAIAVVVQRMVDAEKSGVLFTRHPSTGAEQLILEAAWGLGEAVVSGAVSPDTYVCGPDGKVLEKVVSTKKIMHVRSKEGKTQEIEVPKEKRSAQVLSEAEIGKLVRLGQLVEKHYGTPQDLEWAIEDGEVFLLQARPITTIKSAGKEKGGEGAGGKSILSGLGASPGTASGKVVLLPSADELDRVKNGDVLVTPMTMPDMVPAMKRAAAIVTDEGGMTCFPGDVRVLTDRGLVRLDEMERLIPEGVHALAVDPVLLRAEWKPVVRAMRRRAEVIGVAVSQSGRADKNVLRATPDHKMMTVEGPALVERRLEALLAREEMLATVDSVPAAAAAAWQVPPYLFGALSTDGHWRLPGRRGAVEFVQKDVPEKRAFIEKVRMLYEETFGGRLGERVVRSDSVIRGARVVSEALHLYDQRRAPAEHIERQWADLHRTILGSTEGELLDFLAGVTDGDGTYNRRVGTRLQVYCGDRHLTTAIVLACVRLGIQPAVSENRGCDHIMIAEGLDRILARTSRILPGHRAKKLGTKVFSARQLFAGRENDVNVGGRIRPYCDGNLLIDSAKVERLLPHVRDRQFREALERAIRSPLRMKRVRQVSGPETEDVYNIEVADHHNYVVFTERLTPVLVANCHAAIVSRELGIPCVVGTKKATSTLRDGQMVTVDGEKGQIFEGALAKPQAPAREARSAVPGAGAKVITATSVKVNISMPEAIDRAMSVDPDGVGLLRIEHVVLGLGKHPLALIRKGKEQEYVDYLADAIRKVADPMYPRPVWVRTLDAPTDEFIRLEGGEGEPHEPNPMLGWRGIRRSLDQPELIRAEFKAIKKCHDLGLTNVGIMLPLVQAPEEIRAARRLLTEATGMVAQKDVEFGVMIEIPAAALIAEDLIKEGLDFVSFGTNDLTQYTLAVDRNNEHVAKMYSEFHPAIAKLIEMTIVAARKHGVETSICGQAGSNPAFVEKLIRWGITSVSANIDALPKVRETVARVERQLMLDAAREKLQSLK